MQSTNQQQSLQTFNGELQECCWMQAGVVPYKLCDRDYDCDHCPFDEVFHGRAAKANVDSESIDVSSLDRETHELSQTGSINCKGVDSLFYHPGHVWVRIEEGGAVRTGIDDFGQFVLGRAYAAELPKPGDKVRQGEGCWRLTHQGGVVLLAAPVSGTVKETNLALTQRPTLINRDPYGEGWALVIEPNDLKRCLKRLLYGHQVKIWEEHEIDILTQAANQLPGGAPGRLGVTMTDGGRLSDDFLNNATTEQRRQLIADVFPHSSAETEPKHAILFKDGR